MLAGWLVVGGCLLLGGLVVGGWWLAVVAVAFCFFWVSLVVVGVWSVG